MSVESKSIELLLQNYFEEVYEKGRIDLLDILCTPDLISFGLPAPFTTDLNSLKQMVAMIRNSFSSIRWTAEDVVVEGDKVAVRWMSSSIHSSEFMGIPATGKSVSMSGMDFWHLRDGKIAEKWTNYDMLGLLGQLGASPQ